MVLNIITLCLYIVDIGFTISRNFEKTILICYYITLILGLVHTFIMIIYEKNKNFRLLLFDSISIGLILFFIYKQIISQTYFSITTEWIQAAIILKLIRAIVTPRIKYKRSVLNPAQLFIISFLCLIIIGALLLSLPNATNSRISFLDALFTSTSAVCVTGLTVIDISSGFTQFGQTIIMLLVQAGGLGILTFASYFSYFFKGGSSYENQLALSDISDSNKIGEVFTTLKRIIAITFIIEFIGAFFIFINIDKAFIYSFWERVFFAFFHSISAFCNAGFSTMPKGMMQEGFQFNYSLQFIIIMIFVFGGLGFPIMINILRYFKYFIKRYILWFVDGKINYKAWVMTFSSKINLITTFILILLGTVLVFMLEYSNSLNIHHGFGKFITALFTATTPRSAGLNTIDFNSLHTSTILVIILLMWIGASPASTGGGIKTSTFAIATLNFISLAKGKRKIELFRREVADISVRRAFATMTLSFISIGIGICLVTHFDSQFSLLDIAFECVSAYCTVGLSLGITPELSEASKIVMIILMFTGRVTMLSILIAFFKKAKTMSYQYPTDEIMIN